MKKNDIRSALKNLAQQWPKEGELVYYVEDDHVWLHKIRLPSSERGTGTKKMARFLSIVEKFNMPVCLTADPVEEDGFGDGSDPDTFALVKWYMRFGFIPHGPSEDGFLMERPPQGLREDEILSLYQSNKKHSLTKDEYNLRWGERDFRRIGPSL